MTSARPGTGNDYVFKTIPSPVGILMLVASNDGLAAIRWENDSPRRDPPISAAPRRQPSASPRAPPARSARAAARRPG